MTRDEMLEILHAIMPGAELTALTSEGALECEYVTNKGTAYEWIGMYDWPVAQLRGVENCMLKRIQEKLTVGALSLKDIEDTVFYDLYASFVAMDSVDEDRDDDAALNAALKSLLDIKACNDCELFAIFDSYSDNPSFEFFDDYASMAYAFGEKHISVGMEWDAYDDEDLALWLERLEDNYQGIPFASFGPEDEEE